MITGLIVLVVAIFVLLVILWVMGGETRKLRKEKNKLFDQVMEKYSALEALSQAYHVEYIVKDSGMRIDGAAENESLHDSNVESLRDSINTYSSIKSELDAVLADPSKLQRKLYDPLDDSVLEDPVDLVITHSQRGPVTLTVNRKNRDKYLALGPRAFQKRRVISTSDRSSGHRYSVSGAGYGGGSGSSGFDLVDFIILHELLFDRHGHVQDTDWASAEVSGKGGLFSGAGASETYEEAPSVGKDDPVSEEEKEAPSSEEGKEESAHEEEASTSEVDNEEDEKELPSSESESEKEEPSDLPDESSDDTPDSSSDSESSSSDD
ncbi:MAG: hypothetical protein V1645_01975 [archaeon]